MGWCYYGCTTLGGLAGGVALSKCFARDINSSLCAFPGATSGLAGSGFFSARIKYWLAWIIESVYDIFGILKFPGNNSTVSEIRSTLVLGMYTIWHL